MAAKSAAAKALAAAQDVVERKLRPVYDAVDCRNYKLALKSINAIIQARERCRLRRTRRMRRMRCSASPGTRLTLPLARAGGRAEAPGSAHRACASRRRS